MTPTQVIERAAALGVTLELGDGVKLRYHGPRASVEAVLPDLREHMPAIVAVLRERQPVPSASAAVEAAAHLLRHLAWQTRPAPCAFFIGSAGDAECRRCFGSWLLHVGPPGSAT